MALGLILEINGYKYNVQQILSDILTAQKALQGAVILSDMKEISESMFH